jgi:hypothetical protein
LADGETDLNVINRRKLEGGVKGKHGLARIAASASCARVDTKYLNVAAQLLHTN